MTCVATSIFSDVFLSSFNIENLMRPALFGIISIAAFVIIVGGHLSIGSVILAVSASPAAQQGWSPGLRCPRSSCSVW